MKKIVATIVVGLMAALFHTPVAQADSPVKIMIMGDSITHGKDGDYTWRYFLDRHLRAAGTDFDFVGPRTEVWGGGKYANSNFDRDHNARWGRAYAYNHATVATDQPFNLSKDIMTYNPDIIISQLGVNDLMYIHSPQSLIEVVKGFIAEAREAKAGVDFIFGELSCVNPAAAAYNNLLPQLEELSTHESRIIVADGEAHQAASDTYDGTHPTTSGMIKIAAMYKNALPSLGVNTAALPAKTVAAISLKKPAKPEIRVTTKKAKSVVGWSKTNDVSKTRVWVKRAGKSWKVKKSTAGSKIDMPRRKGYSYKVRVQNYNKAGYSNYSKAVTVKRR